MDNLIEQFAEQVGAVKNVLAMGRSDGVLFTEFELKQFVELIVAECMDSVKTTAIGYAHYTTPHAGLRVEGALRVGDEIARRFKDIGA
jgi:hypothetical protein